MMFLLMFSICSMSVNGVPNTKEPVLEKVRVCHVNFYFVSINDKCLNSQVITLYYILYV